jgi:hypothetical protein
MSQATAARSSGLLAPQRAALLLAWLSSLLALIGCADATSSQQPLRLEQGIRGGARVEAGAWPAVVSLGGCTGTLVHERLVVYAAHCGTAINEVRFGVDASQPEAAVTTDFCRAYPRATLGDGTDLAFCVLAKDVTEAEPARILAGCESSQFTEGRQVTLVGFGEEQEGGSYGLARAASATLLEIGDELIVSGTSADTCKGDSGGPVFLSWPELDVGSSDAQIRLVGVTSAGSSDVCGEGIAHYVNLVKKVDWLEEASGVDITPCFDHGAWTPTPECGSTTCGAALAPEDDVTPPSVTITLPNEPVIRETLHDGQSFFETAVEVTASDVGSGVQRVTFELRDATARVLFQRVDEIPPFGLDTLRLPAGMYEFDVSATDFYANNATARATFRISAAPTASPSSGDASGCGVSAPHPAGSSAAPVLAVLSLLALSRARRAACFPLFDRSRRQSGASSTSRSRPTGSCPTDHLIAPRTTGDLLDG